MLAHLIGALLAHPLTRPYHLPLSPLLVADAIAAIVLVVAFTVPARRFRAATAEGFESWRGRLSPPQVATRAVAVALLAVVIAAGRLGADDELENLAPALVVGVAWPVLTVASVLIGPVWRWLDPWDAVARVLRPEDDHAPGHVWPAVALATVWAWYLSAYDDPLDPRSVGALLAAYTLVTLGGCLAVGRVRWLGMAEPFGIVLSWLALVPRRRLGGWQPPRGAEALLGALIGGVLFGAARHSELWGELNTAAEAQLLATLGVLGACVCGAALVMLVGARAALPAAAAVVLAVALDRNRLSTSLQLLPGLLGDPLGRGWDAFGRAGAGLDPAPLGISGLILAQLAVLLAGYAAGAVILARSLERPARLPPAAGLALLAGLSTIAVATH